MAGTRSIGLAIVATVAGCGRLRFDPLATTLDANDGGIDTPSGPNVSFVFDPVYTAGLAPDNPGGGIPLLAIGYANPVGTVEVSGFPAGDPVTVVISELDAAGDFVSPVLEYDTSTAGNTDDTTLGAGAPIFHFDGTTFSIVNPLGMVGGPFGFTLVATDTITDVQVTSPFTVQIQDGDFAIFIGSPASPTTAAIDPPGATAIETLSGVSGNEMLIGRANSSDTLLGGGSHDLLIEQGSAPGGFTEPVGGHARMFGGAASATFIFQDPTFLNDGFSICDGATIGNTLQLGSPGLPAQTFDFRGTAQAFELQTITLTASNTAGTSQNLVLDLQDLFTMTTPNRTLSLQITSGSPIQGTVNLFTAGAPYQVDGGSVVTGPQMIPAETGVHVISAVVNGSTVSVSVPTGNGVNSELTLTIH